MLRKDDGARRRVGPSVDALPRQVGHRRVVASPLPFVALHYEWPARRLEPPAWEAPAGEPADRWADPLPPPPFDPTLKAGERRTHWLTPRV